MLMIFAFSMTSNIGDEDTPVDIKDCKEAALVESSRSFIPLALGQESTINRNYFITYELTGGILVTVDTTRLKNESPFLF